MSWLRNFFFRPPRDVITEACTSLLEQPDRWTLTEMGRFLRRDDDKAAFWFGDPDGPALVRPYSLYHCQMRRSERTAVKKAITNWAFA